MTTRSGHRYGGACANKVRIRRDAAEAILLGPIRDELLGPARVDKMAKEMQVYYAERMQARQAKTTGLPRELCELTARIERLRERLKTGDPDMEPDEIRAALDRAEGKLRELQQQQPEAKATAKMFAMIPRTAALYRQQVKLGLDGNAREALKARIFLRGLFVDGRVTLTPDTDAGLWAKYSLAPAALLKASGVTGHAG